MQECTPSMDSDNPDIVVHLSHSRDVAEPFKHPASRMVSRIIAADVRPPDMVSQVPLEAIRLNLVISKRRETNPRKRKRNVSTADAVRCDSLPEYWRSTRSFVDALCSDGSEEDQLFDSFTFRNPLEEMLLLPTVTPALSLSSQTSMDDPWDEPWGQETFPVKDNTKQINTFSPHRSDACELIKDETMVNLIDGALRLSLCDRASKVGAKTKNNSLKARLADIAPALWSPQYLLNLSQRA
ncbi:hypothetical protein LTS18_011817, partial [Coniosporium uncinatum]